LTQDRANRNHRGTEGRIIRLLQAASNPMLLAEAIDPADLAGIDADLDDAVADDPDAVPLTDERSRLAAVFRTYVGGSVVPAKVDYVVRRCRELVGQKHKLVIWTVFLGNVALLEQLLADLRPLVVTGEVPAYEAEDDESAEDTREQRITQFKTDPQRMVLIANAAACSDVSMFKPIPIDANSAPAGWKVRFGRGQVILLEEQALLLVLTEKGQVVLLEANPERYVELGRFQALKGKTWNHPVIAGGRLYARNAEEMACYDLGE
jgi:hypothetical protein